jgi:hypothetical protein
MGEVGELLSSFAMNVFGSKQRLFLWRCCGCSSIDAAITVCVVAVELVAELVAELILAVAVAAAAAFILAR